MARTIVASCLALALGAAVAQAQTPYPVLTHLGPYITGAVGGSFTTDDPYNDSVVIGGGIGWRFNPYFRTDATFMYRPDYGPDSSPSVSDWTAMVNGYLDFNTVHLGAFVPYVKAGIGMAENTIGSGGGSSDHFAWDMGAGVTYALSDHTAIDVDYQYISMGDTTRIPVDLHANEVKVGFRFGF